jgi:hypothetical protein
MWKFGDRFPIVFGPYGGSSSISGSAQKIRIGNDIQFKIQLNLGGETPNILGLKAYFVNTTKATAIKKEYGRINKFIGRFPIEPYCNEYDPTPYCINGDGDVRYYAQVANMYNGFGLRPEWHKPNVKKMLEDCTYRASVNFTKNPKIVTITFPAEDQKLIGVYDLVIVANVYDPAFKDCCRTVSSDYEGVFELVTKQSEAIDNPVKVEIADESEEYFDQDVYVISGSYNEDAIHITRNDGKVVNINVSPITGWYEGD